MGISIGTVTQGYSASGAEAFKQKIHQEAIIETKSKLGNIGGITSALEAGWQGHRRLLRFPHRRILQDQRRRERGHHQ